jgi:hypothetical protein
MWFVLTIYVHKKPYPSNPVVQTVHSAPGLRVSNEGEGYPPGTRKRLLKELAVRRGLVELPSQSLYSPAIQASTCWGKIRGRKDGDSHTRDLYWGLPVSDGSFILCTTCEAPGCPDRYRNTLSDEYVQAVIDHTKRSTAYSEIGQNYKYMVGSLLDHLQWSDAQKSPATGVVDGVINAVQRLDEAVVPLQLRRNRNTYRKTVEDRKSRGCGRK